MTPGIAARVRVRSGKAQRETMPVGARSGGRSRAMLLLGVWREEGQLAYSASHAYHMIVDLPRRCQEPGDFSHGAVRQLPLSPATRCARRSLEAAARRQTRRSPPAATLSLPEFRFRVAEDPRLPRSVRPRSAPSVQRGIGRGVTAAPGAVMRSPPPPDRWSRMVRRQRNARTSPVNHGSRAGARGGTRPPVPQAS